MTGIDEWRKAFRGYVEKHAVAGMTDSDGGSVSLDFGPLDVVPMWNESLVLKDVDGGVRICLRMGGLVCEADEKKVFRFIRGFAASMEVFYVEIGIEVVEDNGAEYTIEATADMPHPDEAFRIVADMSNDYFIVGNPEDGMFAHYKPDGYGDGCYVDTCNVGAAERFDTYQDAVRAFVEDEDLRIWIDDDPHPEYMRPLKVHREIKVTTR